jgi:energy-coupling factor transporter transmembrane protein EcfT
MEKIKYGFKWIFRNFFFIVIGVVMFIFIRANWYRLFDGILIPLIWVLANILFATGLRIATLRRWVGWIFLIVLTFMFFINAFYVFLEIQTKVIDFAKYNGTNYFIVEHMTWDSWESPYQLEKRCGYHMCGNYNLENYSNLKLFYDSKTKLVSVVQRYEENEGLVFTDSNPPRYYDRGFVDFMDHRFYISSKCINLIGYTCTYEYLMYQCGLDNTGCTLLPFKYIGGETFAFLEVNEASQELGFYVVPDHGDEILVYSIGDHPYCHVEGCEILSQP